MSKIHLKISQDGLLWRVILIEFLPLQKFFVSELHLLLIVNKMYENMIRLNYKCQFLRPKKVDLVHQSVIWQVTHHYQSLKWVYWFLMLGLFPPKAALWLVLTESLTPVSSWGRSLVNLNRVCSHMPFFLDLFLN